jgi:hypothetical protein
MWEAIIGPLIKAALERLPRRENNRERLVRAFLELRIALIACHHAYWAYRSNSPLTDIARTIPIIRAARPYVSPEQLEQLIGISLPPQEHLRMAWAGTINSLERALRMVSLVLGVSAPVAYELLSRYCIVEGLWELTDAPFEQFERRNEIPKEIAYYWRAKTEGSVLSDGDDDSDYVTALDALTKYIRDDLCVTPEEIFTSRAKHEATAQGLLP